MVRGNEKREIFLCDQDRERFIDILHEKSREKEYSILAYCLMDNHVHLLIKEGTDQIDRAMKRIGVSYVYYFNKLYERIGHLFQDRFRSEPINDERYLMAAVRYIHNNPVKAKMVKSPDRYRWSSYNEYVSKEDTAAGLTSREFVLKMFSENLEEAIKQFVRFSGEQAREEFIDINEEKTMDKTIKSEAQAIKHIEKVLQEGKAVNLKDWLMNKDNRNELIRYLKDNSILSTRQIAAILGVNRNIVQRVR
ncbi:transposase [Desulfoscipio sp. XC116]|uniref:transposase n=1 Tax=Desulfoscipio sp. XC116 TaxID=3144975 RepID=UPI00325AD5E2